MSSPGKLDKTLPFNKTNITSMDSNFKTGFPGPVDSFKDLHESGFTLNYKNTQFR